MPAKKTGQLLERLRALMKSTKYVREPIHAYIIPTGDAHVVRASSLHCTYFINIGIIKLCLTVFFSPLSERVSCWLWSAQVIHFWIHWLKWLVLPLAIACLVSSWFVLSCEAWFFIGWLHFCRHSHCHWIQSCHVDGWSLLLASWSTDGLKLDSDEGWWVLVNHLSMTNYPLLLLSSSHRSVRHS